MMITKKKQKSILEVNMRVDFAKFDYMHEELEVEIKRAINEVVESNYDGSLPNPAVREPSANTCAFSDSYFIIFRFL